MDELQNLQNSILNEDEIPNDNYERIINENFIDMEFFLGLINTKGLYQSRILQIFVAMMFIIGIQFNQIVYLFISPQFRCQRSQGQDNKNLFSKNTHLSFNLTQKPLTPIHTDCIMADYGQCNHTNIIKESLYLNSPVSMFGLYCRKRPFRSVLKIMIILASMIGGLVASCIAQRRKKLSVLLMFGIMAVCVCTNSAAYHSTPQSRYESQDDWFGNPETFQQQWSPIDPLNLIDFHLFTRYLIADDSIWFIIFYMGASFGGFGCLITMQSYMQDFYSVEQQKENRYYLILAFSSSQLLASFLKLFILDWRVFSLFIGIPSILIMIPLTLYVHDNPQQSIDNLVRYSPHNITNISLEQIKQQQPDNKSINLEEKIYINFMKICQTNQRPFLSHWQFQVALDRLIQCHKKGEQNLNFSFSIGLIFILTTFSILYMTPFFMINEYGSGIIFNLSMLSISEILALVSGKMLLDPVNPRESIKYNLLLSAIVGFIIAFADFRDICNDQAQVCSNMVQK